MTKEIVKRLTPTKDTLRELYLKSGNQCAYPGCTHVILDGAGTMLGQICHIEAAEDGGERFNLDQNNEERRQFSNLLLLCYDHHVMTNNVKIFDVPKMRQIKHDHESKFTDIGSLLSSSFEQMDSAASKLANLITGGDSIPIVRQAGSRLSLSHFKGNSPIYDIRVTIQEYWWPNPDESLPKNFWIEVSGPPGARSIYVPKFRRHGKFDFSTLVTSRGEILTNKFDKTQILFPETGKWLLDIEMTARNGKFRQFIAGKTIEHEGKNYWVEAMLLEDGNGDMIFNNGFGDYYWVEVPVLTCPDGSRSKHPGKKYVVW